MSDVAFASGGLPRSSNDATAVHTDNQLPHYVSGAPFDPYVVERMTPVVALPYIIFSPHAPFFSITV